MNIRHNWSLTEISELFDLPFLELMHQAQSVHRANFNANEIQLSRLLSIKTGACPEDCKYCPQSGHYDTQLAKEPLMELDTIVLAAKRAKEEGASRFCMGAAWKNPPKKDMPKLAKIISQVKDLGLETCMTLGTLSQDQADDLAEAGLDYYNHNLDTSPEYYKKIISTRTYDERLDTLEHVRTAGMKVCCGGIIGMGESKADRYKFLQQLANLPQHPESVPINKLIKIKGTPLQDVQDLDDFDFIRTIAVTRMLMPKSYVRLSAGRDSMNEQTQAWCFFAGVNSIFYGDELLTSANCQMKADKDLMAKLQMQAVATTSKQPNETGVVGKSVYYEAANAAAPSSSINNTAN
jgi:biotin synthase